MAKEDIRWIQRFNNYNKSLQSLIKAVKQLEEYGDEEDNEIIQAGVIKFFEMTYELAWNTMKDYYENQGETGIQGSKDAIKLAFTRELIKDSKNWFAMIDSRKLSVHTYDQSTANQVVDDVASTYMSLFIQLQTRLQIEKIEQQKLGTQGSLPLEN
ncbi:MAG TPA: nucleotidyltransferase substrate binding protein [Chryseolinea sp.]|nr:nucleotidyltransferase substrate binding protein [Chryseolinea sp.]HPM31214.1 nucleotidyltransferase substrate binding protein [Chryseolinea sp.]